MTELYVSFYQIEPFYDEWIKVLDRNKSFDEWLSINHKVKLFTVVPANLRLDANHNYRLKFENDHDAIMFKLLM